MKLARFVLVVPLALALSAHAEGPDPLLAGFQSPPDSAKPHTWWHWINGNISKAGITADLEAMKKIGIGGAQIFNVDVGVPGGKTPFMSPQWQEAIAHACKEAKRLGIELCIHNCSGWSSSGGPWIQPQYAMQFLTWSETKVEGPKFFDGILPEPPKRADYYEDIAVYIVKDPATAGFRVPNINPKAGFERGDRIAPDLGKTPDDAAISPDDIKVVHCDKTGHITADIPDGNWTVIRLGHTITGAKNEPSPEAGHGWEVDKLSRKAMDTHWAGMMASALRDNGPVGAFGLNNALIDSYEVGSQNWTPEFASEFKKRRGYDPMPYLPAMTGRVVKDRETTERFLWDVRRTICDLFADNYFEYFTELCHKAGIKASIEGYGNGSFDNLQVGGFADIPMGEFWIGGGAMETTKLAASTGHIAGKPVIGAESFTADTPRGRWLADPYSIKALGDKVFCMGINRYIFHRYAHQPWTDVVPGMTMGPWGTHFDRTLTWWDQGSAWMKYIARCQYLLQSGRFVADVAAFSGEEGPNDMPMLYGNPVPAGYEYDGVDASALLKAHVEGHELVLASGMRYRVLMLPESTWMTPKVAHKIADLVRDGATVLGPKPEHSPSLADLGAGDKEVARVGEAVWGTASPHAYGKGRVYFGVALSKVLDAIAATPDVQFAASPWNLNWIHRTINGAETYFVANPRNTPGQFQVSFRVTGMQPEVWNPETGQSAPALVWSSKGGRTLVNLRLESAGSAFVVFRSKARSAHVASVKIVAGSTVEPPRPKVSVVKARYEAVDGAGGVDVTKKVADMLARGDQEIGATNNNFGDPTYMHVKRLVLDLTVDGKPVHKVLSENEAFEVYGTSNEYKMPDFVIAGSSLQPWITGTYEIKSSTGRTTKRKLNGPQSLPVQGSWKLSFQPNLGAPASATFDKLASWTESNDPGIKYYSGSASYETQFSVPAGFLAKGRSVFLDLGKVKNFAEVTLNGFKLDTLWKVPFRLDVTKAVRAGQNSLVVRVTNLWPNRLIGDEFLPDEVKWNNGPIAELPEWALDMKPRPKSERITFTTWHFFTKDSPLLESGLIGPVRLLSVENVKLVH